MFYCEECRQEKNYPKSLLMKSEGPCELCNKEAVCHDTPHLFLEQTRIYDAVVAELRADGLGEILDAIHNDLPQEEIEELTSQAINQGIIKLPETSESNS